MFTEACPIDFDRFLFINSVDYSVIQETSGRQITRITYCSTFQSQSCAQISIVMEMPCTQLGNRVTLTVH